jgi:hypothetical protein
MPGKKTLCHSEILLKIRVPFPKKLGPHSGYDPEIKKPWAPPPQGLRHGLSAFIPLVLHAGISSATGPVVRFSPRPALGASGIGSLFYGLAPCGGQPLLGLQGRTACAILAHSA